MPAQLSFFDRVREFITSRRFAWIVTILFGLLVVLYFLFVTFLFNPFEDDLGDIASIVPREVDYFYRWQAMGDRFGEFPEPAIWAQVQGTSIYRELENTGQLEKLGEEFGVTAALAGLEEATRNTPTGLNLKADLMREIALAGRGSPELGSSYFDGVLMLRASLKVKAGVSLLDYGFVRDKLPETVAVVSEGGGRYRLPAFEPFGGQDAWLMRIRDVVLLASRKEWLDSAEDLNNKAGEGSLGLASVFHDNVTAHLAPGSEPIESFMRWDRIGPDLVGDWPSNPETFGARLAGRMFSTTLLQSLAGYWLPGERFEGRFTGALDLARASDFQRRWYDDRNTLSIQKVRRFANMLPNDTFFFAGMSGDPSSVMQELHNALDDEERRFYDEVMINTGQYQGMADFFNELPGLMSPGVFLALRRDDYPASQLDVKEKDDQPVPLFLLLATQPNTDSAQKNFNRIVDFFKAQAGSFTRGRQRPSLEEVPVHGGRKALSFVSKAVPGTGEILVHRIPSPNPPVIVITNSYKYLDDCLKVTISDPARALAKKEGFAATLSKIEKTGSNFFFFLDPSEGKHWLDEVAQEEAKIRFEQESTQFFRSRRPEIEQQLRQELFGGRTTLRDFEMDELKKAIVDRLISQAENAETRIPEITRQIRQESLHLQLFDWFSINYRAGRRAAELVISGEMDL